MSDSLKGRKEVFARLLAEGHAKRHAAKLAGYQFPDTEATRLCADSRVQKRVTQLIMSSLVNECLPKAQKAIYKLINDPDTNSAIKLKASQYVIDKAIDLQNMISLQDITNKNPLDMSQVELEIYTQRARIVINKEESKRKAMIDMGIIEAEE